MNILYVTEMVPFHCGNNEQVRAYYQIRALLEEGCTVDCIFFHENFIYVLSGMEVLCRSFNQKNIKIFTRQNINKNYFTSIIKGFPGSIAKFTAPELNDIIRDMLKKHPYDVIQIQSKIAHNLSVTDGYPKVVIDYIGSESLKLNRQLGNTNSVIKKYWLKEKVRRMTLHETRLGKIYPIGIVQSEKDRKQFHNHNTLKVIPNIKYFPPRLKRAVKKEALIFTGMMNKVENIEAAKRLVNHIFVPLKETYQSLECWIVGGEPSDEVLALNNIEGVSVTGSVEDLSQHIRNSSVYIAPQTFGNEAQQHLIEAATQVVPIILTEEMNSMIGFTHQKEALIAITDSDFKEKIKDVLEDSYLRNRLSRNAKKYIKQRHSNESVLRLLMHTYLSQHSDDETSLSIHSNLDEARKEVGK
ncbi:MULTISPECIES: glycosyltransferase [Bacillaceae]|uniref:Glycosyltransferase n=1 Tax=Evansella alkalicola TaxID=745819 RepID=A0ABS6JQQ4_9BACI|nr:MULTISPECIES: glycosyltransferase [Bacillaceae]MBU9720607.1 glycosyltransferase [Bacillus alkalicola]